MASDVSWVAIIRPTEIYFCPVASGSNPRPKPLDRNHFQEVFRLLGEELAQGIACDPDLSASIWLEKRIEVRWTKNRPEIYEKVNRCLEQAGILKIEMEGKKGELNAHRLSLALSALYEYNMHVTKDILSFLAAKGSEADLYVGKICYLNQIGFSSDEIFSILNANKEDCERVIFIVDEFDLSEYSLVNGRLKKLIGNKAQFELIYYVVSALHNSDLLTQKICEHLLQSEGYARQLFWGMEIMHGLDSSLNHEIDAFLLQCAENGLLHLIIPALEQLKNVGFFCKKENVEMFNLNKIHIPVILDVIEFLNQARIPLTRNFCELLIGLVDQLSPLDTKNVISLAENAEHSHTIRVTVNSLREAGFPLTRSILLFLIENPQEAGNIWCNAYHLGKMVRAAEDAGVSLFQKDLILLMENAIHACAIAIAIQFLHEEDIPFRNVDFPSLVAVVKEAKGMINCDFSMRTLIESVKAAKIRLVCGDFVYLMRNSMHAYEISLTMQYLRLEGIRLTREDFILLIENGAQARQIKSVLERLNESGIMIRHDTLSQVIKKGAHPLDRHPKGLN